MQERNKSGERNFVMLFSVIQFFNFKTVKYYFQRPIHQAEGVCKDKFHKARALNFQIYNSTTNTQNNFPIDSYN